MKFQKPLLLPAIVSAIVLTAVITGLILSGSPAEERLRQFDQERISDLQQIQYAVIDEYYNRFGSLPDSLEIAMKNSPSSPEIYTDPETKSYYDYSIISDKQYQLCAFFSLSSKDQTESVSAMWSHDSGYACFTLQVTDTRLSPEAREKMIQAAPVQ
jgi:hypothetical protein